MMRGWQTFLKYDRHGWPVNIFFLFLITLNDLKTIQNALDPPSQLKSKLNFWTVNYYNFNFLENDDGMEASLFTSKFPLNLATALFAFSVQLSNEHIAEPTRALRAFQNLISLSKTESQNKSPVEGFIFQKETFTYVLQNRCF